MPHSRTQHDPEQLSRPTAADPVACDEQGQRLDAVRAEFRAAWEAKRERAEIRGP